MADLQRLQAALADRYEIQREIGTGGMATVYLARDLRHAREVAIKVLRPDLSSALGAERFLREIRIAANLQHPHILPVFDSGEADGFLFYVMPFESGQSLAGRLAQKGEFPVPEAVRLLRDVVEALAHAHGKGVVHRDIKPDNVMLSGRHAVVTDFGVAKAIGQATGEDQLTTVGVAVGTPAYMAPEQAVADERVDHRADIYAVGVLGYELLAGRPPFLATTPQMMLTAHVTETPDPVTKYREATPPQLARIIEKCLEKKPADRWQTAEELLTHLDALVTPSGGFTPTGTTPLRPPLGFRRALPWVVTATLLALGVAAMVHWGGIREPVPGQGRIVVAEFMNETGDPALDLVGRQAGHWITQGLLRVGGFDVVPWETALQASRYVRSEVGKNQSLDPVRGLANEVRAGIVISGAYYRGGDSLGIQITVSDLAEGGRSVSLDPVLGLESSPGGLIDQAQQKVVGFMALSRDQRLPGLQETIGNQPTFEAYRAFDDGMDHYLGRDWGEAAQDFHEAISLDSTFAAAYLYAISSDRSTGETARADSLLEDALSRRDQFPALFRNWFDYYEAMRLERYQDALDAIRRASQIAPQSMASYRHAVLARRLNRPHEALEALSNLDPERGAVRGFESYWTALAMTYAALDEIEAGLEATKRWRELYPDQTFALWIEAYCLAHLARYEALDSVLHEAEVVAMADLGFLSVVRGMKLENIEVLLKLREDGRAREYLDQTLAWFENRPPDEQQSRSHRRYYGRALFLAGKYEEAQGVYDGLIEERPGYGSYQRDWAGNDRAFRAMISANRGDRAQALADDRWFSELGDTDVRGFDKLSRAIIASALGNPDQAVVLLQQAYDEGFFYAYYHRTMIEFAPLWEYEPFQDLMRPKG